MFTPSISQCPSLGLNDRLCPIRERSHHLHTDGTYSEPSEANWLAGAAGEAEADAIWF